MKRRTFLTSAAAPCTLAVLPGCEDKTTVSKSRIMTTDTCGKLAGFTLEEIRELYRYDLFDDFLPFLDQYIIDREYGGFMCNTDRDGTHITTNKSAGYEGRGVWVYSFLYRHLAPEKKYLEVARKSVEFLLKNEPSGDAMWPSLYARDGKPLAGPNNRIYNDAFIATGFQEYAKATGEMTWWNKAKDIMMKLLRIYDRPDYIPDFASVSYYLGEGAPSITGPRCIGEWMVLFRIAVQMLEFRDDPDIQAVKRRCIDAVLHDHYNPDFDLINELLEFDLSLPDNEIAQLVYTGHAFQILWMFMYEAVRTGDTKLFETSVRLFRRHIDVSLDDVYGGVFQCLQHVDNNTWLVDKPLWTQEEALIGALYAVEHTGEHWAKEMFANLYTFVREKFILKQYGFPLWILHGDRKVTFKRHTSRIGNFHHPRHLMLNLMSLDRMIR